MAPLCEIEFENENSASLTFSTGDKLRCNVTLNLDQPRMMKGVFATISGWANCSWSERRTYGDISITTKHVGQEGFIDSQQYLVGSADSDVFELPAGVHSYSFVYQIPAHLPSTFEGAKGHIRYDVKVTVNRPFPLLDDNFKKHLTIMKPYDLNNELDYLGAPYQNNLTKTFGCFSWKSKPLTAVASIPQIGYVPGQLIKIHIDVNNESDVTIASIKYSLVQFAEFWNNSHNSKWIELNKICHAMLPGVIKNDSKNYDVALRIPPIPPTDETSCKVIHVTYSIKIKFYTNWMHSNKSFYIPIVIGTVPLGPRQAPLVVEESIYDSPVRKIQIPIEDAIFEQQPSDS